MRTGPLIWCLWPGLTRLWLRGDWASLLTAVTFAVLFNFVLLLTFVWTSVLPTSIKAAAWMSLGGFWLASAAQTVRKLNNSPGVQKSSDADLFIRAQNEYLRQHWFEAESLLKECLHQNEEDGDARLLLAGLYRHTKRPGLAREQLDALREIPLAAKWHLELRREGKLLDSLSSSNDPMETATT